MKLIHIVGARPNFIKVAPVLEALSKIKIQNILVHTGQHYDYKMSDIFFQELNIPKPDYFLGVKAGTHGVTTGNSIIKIEEVLLEEKPDGIILYGDVNATLAGAIAASKLHIPIFHIEAGCRSFDRKMPEEINRILVDNISDLLFCTEDSATQNLLDEGFNDNIHMVGNVAIDTLHKILDLIKDKAVDYNDYYLCTLHRPFNVDNKETLHKLLTKINNLDKKVIIPAHPRLKNNIQHEYDNLTFIEPLGYLDFINHIKHSSGIISDSGGIQCETAVLKKPLLTVRPTTEHLLTLNYNNTLVNGEEIKVANFKNADYIIPTNWDGRASQRVADIILKYLTDDSRNS